jgi:hypothetical protein
MGRWAAKEVEKFGAEVRGQRRVDASFLWLWAENEFFRGDYLKKTRNLERNFMFRKMDQGWRIIRVT